MMAFARPTLITYQLSSKLLCCKTCVPTNVFLTFQLLSCSVPCPSFPSCPSKDLEQGLSILYVGDKMLFLKAQMVLVSCTSKVLVGKRWPLLSGAKCVGSVR